MRTPSPLDNPFDLTKASDFSDSEIAEQWVDLTDAAGGLLSILKPRLRMPMLLLGGKGSGKTHLMRYCSAPVQATRRGGNLEQAIAEDGYLGVYVHADALNTDKFTEGGQPDSYWARVFSFYFELWLATALLSTLSDYIRSSNEPNDQGGFVAAVADLFDTDVRDKFGSISELAEYLTNVRKGVDFAVNNSTLSGSRRELEITFSHGRLVFGIPDLIGKYFDKLRETLIVYLIDEVENFTEDQQKFLNSLIRYRRGNATIKLGARLYGIKTYDTLGSGEPIRRGAEYERVELDRLLREQPSEYKQLVSRLVVKRLKQFAAVSTNERELFSHFAEIDSSDFWQSAGEDLSRPGANQVRPFHKKLLIDLDLVPGMTDQLAHQIIGHISVPKHLYLDKAATFYFRKNWPNTPQDALVLAMDAATQARALIEADRERGAELYAVISHFGSDILAQLYHDYRRRVPYAGFDNMVDLSQGIIRNLLTNLQHIYRRSQFAGEQPFTGGIISVKSQSDGVRDGAAWFWEEAQPPSGGLQVRDAVESLAIFFRTVRFSHSPGECDLCTFSVTAEELTQSSLRTLRVAENWSYLVRLPDGHKNKNRRSVDEKYQLGPMLAPRWEVSEHRRGTIELKSDLANAILDPVHRHALPELMRRRLQRMLVPQRQDLGELF